MTNNWGEKEKEMKEAEKLKKSNIDKKIVYNHSSRQFTQKELDLLSLGLGFGITPKKFPLIEYITATEKLCQSLEEIGDPESVARAQGIRNMVTGELRKGFDMKIKSNLSREERKILREIGRMNQSLYAQLIRGKLLSSRIKKTTFRKCISKLMKEIMLKQHNRRRHY